MKITRPSPIILLAPVALFLAPAVGAHGQDDYTYFIRQVQMPDEAQWDVDVEQNGSRESPLEVNPEGARFELWAVEADPLTSHLLDETYVNSYVPVADVDITSEDPYDVIPRTRADQPFTVTISVSGLSSDPDAPPAAQSVKLLRHVQAYPGDGTGQDIDRGNATLLSQGSLDSNGTHKLEYAVTSIPGADRSKVRGEERFSVYSRADYQAPESQIDSVFVQVWPVADATVSGIDNGTVIKGVAPDLDVDIDDLYPDSYTYAQVYQGDPNLGTQGDIIPGTSLLIDSSVPRSEELEVSGWDSVIDEDGTWTMEIITVTPFGADRLAYRTFEVDRTIEVNGSVTSVE